MSEDHAVYTGGCFCGKIRYELRGTAREETLCHCLICRRTSGAPAVAWATFNAGDVIWLKGTPRVFKASEKAERSFCPDCGTPLSFRPFADPNAVDITLASLDHPELIAPRDHTFTEAQVPWLKLGDNLPRFPRARE